jgi:hypothetical protein
MMGEKPQKPKLPFPNPENGIINFLWWGSGIISFFVTAWILLGAVMNIGKISLGDVLGVFYWWRYLYGVFIVCSIALFLMDAANDRARPAIKSYEEAEKREQNTRTAAASQKRLYEDMVNVCDAAITKFETLPKRLATAESHLDSAERAFTEGAFAPFWDSIEKAAYSLGSFNDALNAIEVDLTTYSGHMKAFDGKPPTFPLTVDDVQKTNVSKGTMKRLNKLVRDAQRDYHFASIYEQRKTNKILVAGFTHLAEALDQMSWRITDSIDELNNSVNTMSSSVNYSLEGMRSDMTKRGEETARMLDNIQRGKRPL